jgi:phosphatidylglycerophosphate synthase
MNLKQIYIKNLKEKEKRVMYASLYRLISPPFVKFFLKINVGPNLITFLSLISNTISFVFYLNFSFWGIVFHEFSVILDYTDGPVARIRKSSSKFGEWFDLFIDKLGYYLLIAGISLGLFLHYDNYMILLLGFLILVAREFKMYNEVLTLRIFGTDSNNDGKKGLKNRHSIISRIIAIFIDIVYLSFPFIILMPLTIIFYFYAAYIAIELLQLSLSLYFILKSKFLKNIN